MKRRVRHGPGLDPGSADLDFAVGEKSVRRNGQIKRRRTLANTARGIVLRTMAGAEEAVVITLMRDRNAAQMRADADHDQPLVVAFLDPRRIRLRVGQACDIDLL